MVIWKLISFGLVSADVLSQLLVPWKDSWESLLLQMIWPGCGRCQGSRVFPLVYFSAIQLLEVKNFPAVTVRHQNGWNSLFWLLLLLDRYLIIFDLFEESQTLIFGPCIFLSLLNFVPGTQDFVVVSRCFFGNWLAEWDVCVLEVLALVAACIGLSLVFLLELSHSIPRSAHNALNSHPKQILSIHWNL